MSIFKDANAYIQKNMIDDVLRRLNAIEYANDVSPNIKKAFEQMEKDKSVFADFQSEDRVGVSITYANDYRPRVFTVKVYCKYKRTSFKVEILPDQITHNFM